MKIVYQIIFLSGLLFFQCSFPFHALSGDKDSQDVLAPSSVQNQISITEKDIDDLLEMYQGKNKETGFQVNAALVLSAMLKRMRDIDPSVIDYAEGKLGELQQREIAEFIRKNESGLDREAGQMRETLSPLTKEISRLLVNIVEFGPDFNENLINLKSSVSREVKDLLAFTIQSQLWKEIARGYAELPDPLSRRQKAEIIKYIRENREEIRENMRQFILSLTAQILTGAYQKNALSFRYHIRVRAYRFPGTAFLGRRMTVPDAFEFEVQPKSVEDAVENERMLEITALSISERLNPYVERFFKAGETVTVPMIWGLIWQIMLELAPVRPEEGIHLSALIDAVLTELFSQNDLSFIRPVRDMKGASA